MTPGNFLRAVWPDAGIYCLATPFTLASGDRLYKHHTFETMDAAISFVAQHKGTTDIFFAVHSLAEHRRWNAAKTDRKTGEKGAYEVRTQANMQAAKCFFFDLDVGAGEHKYTSQGEALAGLKRFCAETALPKPLVTSSGGGLHVYWPLADAIPSTDWRAHASKLRQLAKHHGLKADPSRTTDTASVLRVAGSFNRKDPANPKPVVAYTPAVPTPNAALIKAIDDALIRAGLEAKAPPVTPADTLLGSNLTIEWDGPKLTLGAVAKVCAQTRRLITLRGNVSEPEWYHSVNLVRFLEKGDELVHRLSDGHPDYSADATNAKVHQLEMKGIQPTSCASLAEHCGEEYCKGCPFQGKSKNPLIAARLKDPAPPPVVKELIGTTLVSDPIPDPPKPFTRLKTGGVSTEITSAAGDLQTIMILNHDFYPLRRLSNRMSNTEQQLWMAMLPRTKGVEILFDADAIYDLKKLSSICANHGMYPDRGNLQRVQDYMTAYINELQRLVDAENQNNHLGWAEDYGQFILPDRVLLPDGSVKRASLSMGAQRSSAQVHRKGSATRQAELLRFYNHPGYVANQFFILAGLAAPIFHMTGHHGVVVNASGDPGASKSTSLYTAASFWGQPELYPINGTNNGATVRGRNERVTTLANLPICVDEITHMPIRDAVDLAMSITQPGHRIRLEQTGVERSSNGGYKATMMLATANSSLHSLLSTDNSAGTAGSMRVFEIKFKALHIHKKHEADDYWHELKEHYGHLGEIFMAYVIQNYEAVKARVRAVMREIDIAADIQPGERFWSATVAAVLVTGEIAYELGLLQFAVPAIRDWAINNQIPDMRGTVISQYSTTMGILTDYLETINGNILVANRIRHSSGLITNIKARPHGSLLGHYDTDEQVLWLLKKGFKDYCSRVGANAAGIIDDLGRWEVDKDGNRNRIISHKNARRVLGAGTEYAKAQSWVFGINMAHPDVGDLDVGQQDLVPGLRLVK